MSLIRYLAVGRSIGTITDEPTRYKMSQQNLLPKFNEEGAAEPREPRRGLTDNPVEDPQVRTNPFAPNPGIAVPPATVSANPPGLVIGPAERALLEATPRKLFWDRCRATARRLLLRGATRKRSTGPVQPELRLDVVVPVRNDLRDAELAIFSAAKKVKSPTGTQGWIHRRWAWCRQVVRWRG